MIRITTDLIPKGIGAKKHLGTIYISNDGTGTATRGNYNAHLSRRGNPDSFWKGCKITNFPRKARNAYDLLYLILKQTVGVRND